MSNNLFSSLRELATTVSRAEATIAEREALDVAGARHYALQQQAIARFKSDVDETVSRTKALQPTVVNIQNFGQLNQTSSRLAALFAARVAAIESRFSQSGYEPPFKQPKTGDVEEPVERRQSGGGEKKDEYAASTREMNDRENESHPVIELMDEDYAEPCRADAAANVWRGLPPSPQPPVLYSSQPPIPENEDDSILALELPPTPVCPELISRLNDQHSSRVLLTSPSSLTPMNKTPTTPVLEANKRELDITSIDFNGLGDGEVFHTGFTPKTPVLQSAMLPTVLSTIKAKTEYGDMPAPESNPLKRAIHFSEDSCSSRRPFIKPVSFTEFERQEEKLADISRETLNAAVKKLNAAFKEKEEASVPLDMPQSEAAELLYDGSQDRVGTKIVVMLLKFRRLDCRSVGGLSYISPITENDDSFIGFELGN